MIKISPSVLACDFSKLGEEVKKVENAGAELLHLDVMDGMFVPNISFGPDVIRSVRKQSKMIFDVHLMIEEPIRYISNFVKAGADIITIHYESCENPKEVLEAIRVAGKKAAVSLKPATPASVLNDLLPYVDMVLVMTVEPGFGGQKFMVPMMEKVSAVREMIRSGGYDIDIQVDGGINAQTAKIAAEAGANVLVAGSSVFGAEDTQKAIDEIREAAQSVYSAYICRWRLSDEIEKHKNLCAIFCVGSHCNFCNFCFGTKQYFESKVQKSDKRLQKYAT